MEYNENLSQYLMELGLTKSEINKFSENGNNPENQIEVLRKSRYRILDAVHEQEKSIQQIDYLIHEIKK
ncbi:MAG: hypothetical protein K2H02_04290, partial [Anaeroplasmataceae bacterium]|nr:hypothetical protein [Anaeroplasmataceae bacterium]